MCVRRWHDPAEKVRGRKLFVGKTRTLLSLNRKFIALSKSDDGKPKNRSGRSDVREKFQKFLNRA